MRKTTPLQTQISRSQFLRPQAHLPINHISVKATVPTAQTLPYVGRSGFTPTESFFKHLSHEVLHVDVTAWRLNVSGLVSKPMVLDFDMLRSLSTVEKAYTIAAITSTPNNLLMGHALWKGVAFQDLVERVGTQAEARFVQFRSANGYATFLPVDRLKDAILAYGMNGETLSAEQGYPVRLIVPGVYDYKMPKWVTAIEFVATPSSGHYESRGWSAAGEVQTTSALFTPRSHEVVSGTMTFSGMAFAGVRAISRIEASVDDGEWMPVPFEAAARGDWTCWQIDWQPPASGDYLVKVRATDSDGYTQVDTTNQPVFPNGSSAIHAVVFRVSM